MFKQRPKSRMAKLFVYTKVKLSTQLKIGFKRAQGGESCGWEEHGRIEYLRVVKTAMRSIGSKLLDNMGAFNGNLKSLQRGHPKQTCGLYLLPRKYQILFGKLFLFFFEVLPNSIYALLRCLWEDCDFLCKP